MPNLSGLVVEQALADTRLGYWHRGSLRQSLIVAVHECLNARELLCDIEISHLELLHQLFTFCRGHLILRAQTWLLP